MSNLTALYMDKFSEILGTGPENAITRSDLMQRMSTSNGATLSRMISEARKGGLDIRCDNGKYYIADGMKAFKEYIRSMSSKRGIETRII